MTPTKTSESKSERRAPRFSTNLYRSRRRWNRLPLAIPVFVRGLDEWGNGFVEFTTGFNVNPGGLLVATPRRLPPQGALDLEIPYAMPNRPPHALRFTRYLHARVVYTGCSEGFWLYGLEFTTPLVGEHRDAASAAVGSAA